MKKTISRLCLLFVLYSLCHPGITWGNPWNGKVVLQAFWWGAWSNNYPQDWYTYLAKLAPRLRDMGFDGIWIPSPLKGWEGVNDMGYGVFDHYDLGDKDQKGTVATRFGNKDSLLRFIAVAHANGLEVYPDVVLNHVIGGEQDPNAPGNKFKKFRYVGFSGPESGRWPKDHWNFHPNSDHGCSEGELCGSLVGPDICYLDAEHGGGGNGQYMRDKAREWFVWFKKQTDVDGFRIDAVKHFPAYVTEDLLFNAMGSPIEYFCVGEYVETNAEILDRWGDETQNRCGTFDFSLREALASILEAGGFFDMGSLPNFQQGNRIKSVPFLNNHDTWKGAFWDSEPGSSLHDDRNGDWRQNRDEIFPTFDPDNPRADIATATAFAVDGSPLVYYEDIFINYGPDRFGANPATIEPRDYVLNLIWAHQKLNFKDGAFKVRYQESPDLLVIERSAKALIGLNDSGSESFTATVQTDFGSRVKLHDYSDAYPDDIETDDNGRVTVTVPPMSYAIWGPPGIEGEFSQQPRGTIQEFQMDDDLGDSQPSSLGYGGRLCPDTFRTGGSIWVVADSTVKVELFSDGERDVELRVLRPDMRGNKSNDQGQQQKQGRASSSTPLVLEFNANREGYHQLAARIANSDQACTQGYIRVEYKAPAISDKF